MHAELGEALLQLAHDARHQAVGVQRLAAVVALQRRLEHRKQRQHRDAERARTPRRPVAGGRASGAARRASRRRPATTSWPSSTNTGRIRSLAWRRDSRTSVAAPGVAAQAPRAARGIGRRRQHGARFGRARTASRAVSLGDLFAATAADNRRDGLHRILWVKALHIVFVSSWFAGPVLPAAPVRQPRQRARRQPRRARAAADDGEEALPLLEPADGRRRSRSASCSGSATASASGPGSGWLHAKLAARRASRSATTTPAARCCASSSSSPTRAASAGSASSTKRRCCSSRRSSSWSSSSRSEPMPTGPMPRHRSSAVPLALAVRRR